ncbi:EAL domain-containing protein [Pelagibacterium lacus]|uniref:EAL domain-containing protein n=1 Tax=Pelagibacterium lacus TaxID=2282655 RepID=A0A369W7I3_9HYPH|nr:EAL domain-containing protein [Pelagibacterium lacus]RDE10656.1 EAL domain-containing protein [Pelagibacterium lacus]
MQGLVYIFVGICAAALAIAAYFLLGFTPIESLLLALVVGLGGALIEERSARRRAFARLERGVEDMGRLLATDARAGQVLSERVNAIADLDLGPRLDVIEADMSVLGTVVRQVAEAVSELESARPQPRPADDRDGFDAGPALLRRPSVPLGEVRRALDEGRLVHHVRPIMRLPQRKVQAYTLVPRLEIDGQLVDPPEFMPVPHGEGDMVIRRIERIGADEGVRIVRRARLLGEPVSLLLDISPSTLGDRDALDQLLSVLAANRAVNPDLAFALDYRDWAALDRAAADGVAALVQQGAGLAIRNATTLRLDFAGLAEKGVRYVATAARPFLKSPSALTDFHASDISDYIRRFGINLLITGTDEETDILGLLDDGIRLAEGRALGALAPLGPELSDEAGDQLRRAGAR